MKKFLLSIALLCAALSGLQAQDFKPSGASAADVAAFEDKEIVTAEADINKDGIKDLVIAVPDNYSGNTLAFYFGQANGGYKLFRDYDVNLSPGNTGVTVTAQGVVRFEIKRDEGADIFLFRWENGDFRLIGGKEDRHKSEADYDISYNYLTGKMIRTDGSGKSRKSQTLDMPKQPKIHFGWIPLAYDALAYLVETPEMQEDPLSPDDMLAWGIFRVMQANEMLFWHFCDWENPYRNPISCEEENVWMAEDEHMSPGSYNSWSSLTITKLADGSYELELTESFYDRSYESLFNEDLSNVDEVMKEHETPEEISRTRWIFKDGRFTQTGFTEIEPSTGEPAGEAVASPSTSAN